MTCTELCSDSSITFQLHTLKKKEKYTYIHIHIQMYVFRARITLRLYYKLY